MEKLNNILLTIVKMIALYILMLLCWVITQVAIYGREYYESFEEVHYDYRLYLEDDHIRIESETSSEMIHPDSLEEFIIQDNL